MPVMPIDVEALRVQNLELGIGPERYQLSCSCGFAESFALCFSKRPLRRQDLDLTEQELYLLYQGTNGKTLEKDGYRLQGVPRNVFSISNHFSDFTTTPPERIQVWSMTRAIDGSVSLYVPDTPGRETCFLPLRYRVQNTPGRERGMVELTILVNATEISGYEDGALLYCVGDSQPIPIARECLNHPIRIRANGLPVKVMVSEVCCGQYQCITG